MTLGGEVGFCGLNISRDSVRRPLKGAFKELRGTWFKARESINGSAKGMVFTYMTLYPTLSINGPFPLSKIRPPAVLFNHTLCIRSPTVKQLVNESKIQCRVRLSWARTSRPR